MDFASGEHAQPATSVRVSRFRLWEWALLLGAVPLLLGSLFMYVSDFPLLRHYVLGLEQVEPAGSRVGTLESATGKVRRQRAADSEFLSVDSGATLENGDTLVTDSGASASVLLDDGGRIQLSSDTMVQLSFDNKVSIGGIKRQASIQLVTGSVSGKGRDEAIVVKTVTGKTATLSQSAEQMIREEKVVPRKVEVIAPVIPIEVLAPSLPVAEVVREEAPQKVELVAVPSPTPSPTPRPSPRMTAARISEVLPAPGARISPAAEASAQGIPVRLSFRSSREGARFQVRVKNTANWIGGTLANERVRAQNSEVVVPILLEKPGNYEWSIEDLDAGKSVGTFEFLVTDQIEALDPPTGKIEGLRANSNRFTGKRLDEFPGIELSWEAVEGAESYEITIFADKGGRKRLASASTRETRHLYSKGAFPRELFFYRVSARLSNGLIKSSPLAPYRVKFLAPDPVEPTSGKVFTIVEGRPLRVLLTWRRTNFTRNYRIEVARASNFSGEIRAWKTSENYFNFKPAEPGDYYWRVRAVGEGVTSAPSSSRKITVR